MSPIIQFIILFGLFYIWLPLLIFGWNKLNDKKKTPKKIQNSKDAAIPHKTFIEKLKLWQTFGIKRSTMKVLIAALYLVIPAIVSAVFVFALDSFFMGVLAIIIAYWLYILILYFVIRSQYNTELKLKNNILVFKRSNMGAVSSSSDVFSHGQEFTITRWDDEQYPAEIRFEIPATYDKIKRGSNFISEFSQRFSKGKVWIAKEQETFDDDNDWVTLIREQFVNAEQKKLIINLLEMKRQSMGLVDPSATVYTHQSEFEILEWSEDLRPEKMRMYLPVGFDPMRKETFLDNLSTGFGNGRPWEVDNEDKDFPGWNSDKLVATLKLEAPLPTKAMWDEKWIKNDVVQWSFFPLGLGSKGGVPFVDPDTKEEVRLVGFDVNGAQQKWCQKNDVYADGDLLPAPHAIMAGVTGGGKSVCQRNVILGCLTRPKDWLLMIVDMKKVEGAMWRKYGVIVATTYAEAAAVLQIAQSEMMRRFEEMERRGINNWADMPESEKGPAIMVNVDEAAELLAPIKGKSEEDQANLEFQTQCLFCMESIARLGRAAMVHLLVAAQRPDSTVISMQIRQNCPVRIAAGSLPATISQMTFESNFGATVPSNPRGRVGIRVHSATPNRIQGFFADESWLDEYLENNSLETNIYGSAEMVRKYDENMKMAELGVDEMSQEEYEELEALYGE